MTDVDAIHPGYGFLSENAHFAEVCESCNIRFIGPHPRAMQALADKAVSRALAKKAGVAVPPGSEGVVEKEQDALAIAKRIGYPVMIKAIAGGGGRGMRVAHNDISLVKGYHTARTEAEKAFGNSGVYIEKFIENPHHIEIQILGDHKGRIIHLGERDCSIQRRNQKVIEETPSPLIEHKFRKLRDRIGKAAVKIAEAAHYTNAGTVEFIVDNHGNFYFLEVNKRIQVEHPITEEVTGIDLVRYQILLAMGEPLHHSQGDIQFKGHAIECRINAEDPFNDFRPSPGRDRDVFPARRPRRARGHACLRRLHHSADLRLDDWQADHLRQGPARGDGQDEPRVERIHDHRHQNEHLLPAGHHAGPEFPARRLFDKFHRATARRGAARVDRGKNLIRDCDLD